MKELVAYRQVLDDDGNDTGEIEMVTLFQHLRLELQESNIQAVIDEGDELDAELIARSVSVILNESDIRLAEIETLQAAVVPDPQVEQPPEKPETKKRSRGRVGDLACISST